jgi:hypothetical protein
VHRKQNSRTTIGEDSARKMNLLNTGEADDESNNEVTQGEPAEIELEQELLVSGLIYPAVGGQDGIEIHRGMKILGAEGEVAGVVAGVIHNKVPHQAEYVLLSRPIQQVEYYMVPVELIQQVDRETVLLHIAAPMVKTLARWRN